MFVTLSNGPILKAKKRNNNDWVDVTAEAHEYLNCSVEFNGDVTVGDLYKLIGMNPVLMAIYRRNFIDSFVEYLNTFSEKKLLRLHNANAKKPNAIEFIQLKRFITYDNVNQKMMMNDSGILRVSAISKAIKRSYDGYPKGTQISYSMTGIDVATIYHTPVRYCDLALLSQDNHYSAESLDRRRSEEKEVIMPDIRLNEILEALTWELSFNGSPESTKKFVEELVGMKDDYELKSEKEKENLEVINSAIERFKVYDAPVVAVINLIKSDKKDLTVIQKAMDEKHLSNKDNVDFFTALTYYTFEALFNDSENVDNDRIIKRAEDNLNPKDRLIKDFYEVSETVINLLENDKPVDAAHEERNQIVSKKIAEIVENIEADNIFNKDLKFAINELHDVIDDIKDGIVSEVFIQLSRQNKSLNKGFSERYKEALYGFEKLPTFEVQKERELSDLISKLPNEADMETFVEVMFQNTAKLIDEVKGMTAYEYRVNALAHKKDFGLFRIHENKALEEKERKEYQKYYQDEMLEHKVSERALKIVESGKSIFVSDLDERLKATHRIAVGIRPDVSLLRWKTIVPKKAKRKKK